MLNLKEYYVQICDAQGQYYDILVKKSKRKTVGFIVRKNGSMEICLPYHIAFSKAYDYVLQKKEWFIKKHKQMLLYKENIMVSYYEEDSQIYILGKAYRLKIKIDIQKKIEIKDDILWVYGHSQQTDIIKKQITKWLMQIAKQKFEEAISASLKRFDELPTYKELKIRRMKSSWGNMRRAGVMTLNLALIHTPFECIEFVVTHELCHLKYFNHSKEFYKLMDEVMPDWANYDERLRNYSPLIL